MRSCAAARVPRTSSLRIAMREGRGDADVMQHAGVIVKARAAAIRPRPSCRWYKRKPATTQSAVRACLILSIARLPGW